MQGRWWNRKLQESVPPAKQINWHNYLKQLPWNSGSRRTFAASSRKLMQRQWTSSNFCFQAVVANHLPPYKTIARSCGTAASIPNVACWSQGGQQWPSLQKLGLLSFDWGFWLLRGWHRDLHHHGLRCSPGRREFKETRPIYFVFLGSFSGHT